MNVLPCSKSPTYFSFFKIPIIVVGHQVLEPYLVLYPKLSSSLLITVAPTPSRYLLKINLTISFSS